MLEWASAVGEICLKYLDESGFNLRCTRHL
jgi:hypothetical protein